MDQAIAQLNQAVTLIIPEMILLGTVCLLFLIAPLVVSERGEAPAGLRHRWAWLALLALGCAGYAWWIAPVMPVNTGPFRVDALAWYLRGLSIAAGLVLVLLNWNQAEDGRAGECQACLLAICAGLSLVGLSNDLVTLFLALELISLPTYLLLLLPRRDAPAQEASIKYFLLSIFSSAIFLFGLSYLYGAIGSTNLVSIYAALETAGTARPGLLAVAVVMLLAGLAFRMTAVPFHFYSPDVFQGGPFSAAAMLAVVPKMAGLVALIRLLAPALPGGDEVSLSGVAGPVLWWLAVLSMVLGNLLALVQTDLRRLLAFSSVAHAGYMLAGLAVGRAGGSSPTGVEATLFYLVVYAAMTLGVFAALTVLGGANRKVVSIQDLAGLARSRPAVALLLGLCLLSLTGLPPTAGFLGKLNLLLACWSAGTAAGQWLAFWIVLSAAIGAAYYLRLVGILFLQEPVQAPAGEQETPAWVAMCVCAAATVVMFFVPGGLWQAVQNL